MGVIGGMFPGRKITDEAGEDGDAQPWRLGPIDLDRGIVQVHRAVHPAEENSPTQSEASQSQAVEDQ